MNEIGREYINEQNQNIEKVNKYLSKIGWNIRFISPQYTDSVVHERFMRMGRENKVFELGDFEQNKEDYYQIALATLKEDFCKPYLGVINE